MGGYWVGWLREVGGGELGVCGDGLGYGNGVWWWLVDWGGEEFVVDWVGVGE